MPEPADQVVPDHLSRGFTAESPSLSYVVHIQWRRGHQESVAYIRFEAGAKKSRFSRSPPRFRSGPGTVVRSFLTHLKPFRPRVRIARSTAPRDAPARPGWRRDGEPLPPPVEAFRGDLVAPSGGIELLCELADLVLDQNVCDGEVKDASQPRPSRVI